MRFQQMTRRPMNRLGFAILLLLAAVLSAGCFNPFAPRLAGTAGISEPPPRPSSAVNVLRLFEWCWDHQRIDEYREIFTADYQFQFALVDSAGNPSRRPPLNREEDLETATNLFVRGTATEPPANRITLDFDNDLRALPDLRRGKDPRFHKEIVTTVLLRIYTDNVDYEVKGHARFFMVRGDSALIPQELVEIGFTPDSTRWYIERWEDETIEQSAPSARAFQPPPGRLAAAPAEPAGRLSPPRRPPLITKSSESFHVITLGKIKALYLR